MHFILHVPKCAGTTVEHHFASALGPGYLLAPRWESVVRNFIGNRYDYTPGDPRLRGVRVVSGHSLSISLKRHFPGREIRQSVLIREPLGFLLSFYNYRVQRHADGHDTAPPSFEAWYRVQRRNQITRFILNRYFGQGVPELYLRSSAARLDWLEEKLAGFWFVGGHHRAGEMIAGISRDLGIPEVVEDRNVTRSKRVRAADLPKALSDRIAGENALDQALYDRWCDRGWRADAPRLTTPPPALPRHDQPATLLRETVSSIAKRLIR